jgi:hypothetical protein
LIQKLRSVLDDEWQILSPKRRDAKVLVGRGVGVPANARGLLTLPGQRVTYDTDWETPLDEIDE